MRVFLPLLVVASGALGWAIASSRIVVPEASVQHRPVQVATDSYTSSQTCRACHPSQYATWHDSYHRTMTQVATPESVGADFNSITVTDVQGGPMRLEREGPRFFAEFDDPDWSGAGRPTRIRREVVMITGSHHQQIYWYGTGKGRLLGQLPGAYLIEEKRWIPRRMAVLHPPTDPVFSETGHWNAVCIACHATSGRPQFDTPFGSAPIEQQRVDTTVAEFGIACEACHGPGAEHVRVNQNPLRRYGLHLRGARAEARAYTEASRQDLRVSGGSDATIVQPLRLSAKRSSQVCGQCHGIWEFYGAADERLANSGGLPFRPGDELTSTRFVAQPSVNADSPAMTALLSADAGFIRDSFWADGMVRVSGREYNGLIESPCFEHATDDSRTLSCASCHSMHKPPADPRPVRAWANDQLAVDMDGDAACGQCHDSIRTNITAHSRHRAESTGSRCYNCHMPYTTYGLLKTIRSHTVSSPSVAESVDSGRPNACNLCHLDKSLAWTGSALERWYGSPRTALTNDQASVAASLLWALRGDAGQRAIVASALGRADAQAASGTAWMAPFLAELLNDPYDAVRFLAGRSMITLPGFSSFEYDFVAPPATRYQAQRRTMAIWDRSREEPPRRDPALLMTPEGALDVEAVLRLLKQRDNRRVLLRE